MITPMKEHPDRALIAGNQLFTDVPAELVAEIVRDIELIHFESGDEVFQEGDEGNCLYLIGKGSVRISKKGRNDQQETLGFLQENHYFGEMALIDGQPRSATATAATDGTILARLSRTMFEHILEIAPGSLYMNFLHTDVERLRGLNGHFIAELRRTERLSAIGGMANSIIHDLNNPVSAILCGTDLIAARTDDLRTLECTELIRRSAENMMSMIQELLDFSRGKSSIHLKVETVDTILQELLAQVRPLVRERIHVVEDFQCNGTVTVDLNRFVRALLNLAKNAVQAMQDKGILSISAFERDGGAVFRISDTGTGIPPELLPRIFEPFVTQGKSGGTGLGLAIVKSVVEAHKGRITVESVPGHGTAFEVVLPLIKDDGV